MADLCENQIIITGGKECLDTLKNKIKEHGRLEETGESTDFMEYLIGLGDAPFDQRIEEYKEERFGTDDDFEQSDLNLVYAEECIKMHVESRWYPITPFLSNLCAKYNVNACNSYFEPVADYGGRAFIDENGNVNDHQKSFWEAAYLYDKDLFWEEIKYSFEDFDEDDDIEVFLSQLSFISTGERKEIESMWEEYKEDYL